MYIISEAEHINFELCLNNTYINADWDKNRVEQNRNFSPDM